MIIVDYEYSGSDWKFNRVRFQKINLIVGDSGTGKTRLLNTIFNLGVNVVSNKPRKVGEWSLSLKINDDTYRWNLSIVKKDDKVVVEKEQLFLNEKIIVDRDNKKYIFCDHNDLPKLPSDELSVHVLREEKLIKPLYDGFSKTLRRRFFGDELASNTRIIVGNQKRLDNFDKKDDLNKLLIEDFELNPRLYVLSNYFPAIFHEITTYYKETYDFITDIKILDSSKFGYEMGIPGGAPIFCIKERNVDHWLRLDELSSGMQKVLLILTDLLSLPPGSIYLLDEYENSLGIGGIDFLPNLLFTKDNIDCQILITSHHPYIISNIPVEHWYVAHRIGSQVQFEYGKGLVDRYKISSQEKYMQLLNDPIYNEGIE